MKRSDGKKINPEIKRDGSGQRMVARLVYMEPELWDLMQRKGDAVGVSRSTAVRCSVKFSHNINTIHGIDWSEIVTEPCKNMVYVTPKK